MYRNKQRTRMGVFPNLSLGKLCGNGSKPIKDQIKSPEAGSSNDTVRSDIKHSDDPTRFDRNHSEDPTRSDIKHLNVPTRSDANCSDDQTRMSGPLKFPLKDIELITNHFAEANFIGEGFLGKIYEGQLSLQSGTSMDVAVRRLDNSLRLQEIMFEKEISILTRLEHENMVKIVGYCYENDQMLIISERVARGSLRKHLSDPRLTWMTRLKISVGVASALSYLHNNGIIHQNINRRSILLDENWKAKISGFEYCMTIPEGVSLDLPYSKLGIGAYKSDVFSIGILLFELLCGKKAFISEDTKNFQVPLAIYHYENRTLHKLVDPPGLFSQMDPVSFNIFSKIAYNCLIDQRIHMNQILKRLERALKVQHMHDNNEYSTVAVEHTIPETLKLKLKSLEHMRIPLADILTATENFAAKCCIVSGGFGSVFKSELEHVDKAYCFAIEKENEREVPKKRSTVAIKRIMDTEDEIAEHGFYAEIEMLTSCKHSNIITLLGFCDEGGRMILIYEYASHGSLNYHLQNMGNNHNDSWAQRVKICLDVAKGLSCLHTTEHDRREIVHRDIKSANILLDENFEAKIGDFGLSVFRYFSEENYTRYSRTVAGTPGYMDPQYSKDRKLKKESDVYSFGVILFEILCGTVAYDTKYAEKNNQGLALLARQHFNKGSMMEIIDPKIKNEISGILIPSTKASRQDSLDTFCEISFKCLAEKQVERPTMEVVVKELEKALFLNENNKDDLEMTLEEIVSATQAFSDKNLIGKGTFGMVYKGKVTRGNQTTTVVVKRFDRKQGHEQEMFLNELIALFDYRHENIIGLEGYCNEKDEKIIVYEYASRHSLDNYLNNANLTWIKRLKICIDIVRGLAFLHGGAPTKEMVVHRDIRCANVLIYEDWKAKISDFELSDIASVNQVTVSNIVGPVGYLDPLYVKTGFVTEKSDIYSLGVVLFEILSGRQSLADTRDYRNLATRIFEQIHEEGKTESIVFKDIKKQIAPKSLSTFRAIVSQCLVHDGEKRPTAEEVLHQLEKSLELQEDYDIWGPKLPKDYEEILKMSAYSETYSTEMNKNLYNLLIKGILLQDDKLLFTLGSNGERSEVISARKFSYRNCSPHDNWCSNVPKSRFMMVAEMLDISNLMIKIETRAQFLSPNTVYGVYLIFKFSNSRNVSRTPMYVDLKYRKGNETLHAYFAKWRDDKWMMIELYRFFNHIDDGDIEVLLESLSTYYYREHDAIYVEGIEFRPIDNVELQETEKSREIKQVLESNSNLDQVLQMPTKSEMILKGSINYDYGEELFSLTEVNGKKHLMLSAKAALNNITDFALFNSKPSPESRFKEVLELLPQQIFRINCMIKSQMLSRDTEYACYLVFELSEKCHELHGPVEVRDLLQKHKDKVTEFVYFRTPSPWNIHNITRVPKQRKDGWMEVNVWKFNSRRELDNDCVRVNLKLISYEGSISGLIVCGLEFRAM